MTSTAARFVLFDVDGLLLDTEIVYTRVTQAIVSRFGKTFDWSIKANMIGRAESESSRYLVETLKLPITAEEYLAERNDRLKEGFAACDPMPGAERLIRHLHANGIPIAVATSSTRELFESRSPDTDIGSNCSTPPSAAMIPGSSGPNPHRTFFSPLPAD